MYLKRRCDQNWPVDVVEMSWEAVPDGWGCREVLSSSEGSWKEREASARLTGKVQEKVWGQPKRVFFSEPQDGDFVMDPNLRRVRVVFEAGGDVSLWQPQLSAEARWWGFGKMEEQAIKMRSPKAGELRVALPQM